LVKLFSLLFFSISLQSIACGGLEEDCQVKSDYKYLKNGFNSLGIDINYIAEYRALRFIDRGSWEKKGVEASIPVEEIYNPSPDTWGIWSTGSNYAESIDISLLDSENDEVLVKSLARHSISKKTTDDEAQRHCPGDYRNSSRKKTGDYLTTQEYKDFKSLGRENLPEPIRFERLDRSVKKWGKKMTWWYYYIPGRQVEEAMGNWQKKKTLIFREVDSFEMSPLEAGAILQRHFVYVHPFYDGNGRVSRFIQDLVSKKYGMPYIPAGDLQNDLIVTQDKYTNLVKDKTARMIRLLKDCLNYQRSIKYNASTFDLSGEFDRLENRCRVLPTVNSLEIDQC